MQNKCVCCGDSIPEGRMICVNCESRFDRDLDDEQVNTVRQNRKIKSANKNKRKVVNRDLTNLTNVSGRNKKKKFKRK